MTASPQTERCRPVIRWRHPYTRADLNRDAWTLAALAGGAFWTFALARLVP